MRVKLSSAGTDQVVRPSWSSCASAVGVFNCALVLILILSPSSPQCDAVRAGGRAGRREPPHSQDPCGYPESAELVLRGASPVFVSLPCVYSGL